MAVELRIRLQIAVAVTAGLVVAGVVLAAMGQAQGRVELVIPHQHLLLRETTVEHREPPLPVITEQAVEAAALQRLVTTPVQIRAETGAQARHLQ